MATSSTDNSKDSSIDQHLRHNECALCLEQFKSPRILPCFHTFCLSCIKRLTLNLQPSDSFPCPSCRTAVQIPPGGADSFQVNFYIEAEMERAKCYESHAAPDCDICGNTRATHKCLDCNQMSCDNCTRIHGSFAATRDHSVLSLGSFLSGGGGISYKTDRLCGIHHEEKLRFFCSQCHKLICRDCKLTSHEGHASVDISKKGAAARQVIAKVTETSRQNLEPKLKQVLGWARDHKDRLIVKKGHIRDMLRERADDIKKEVDACLTDTEALLDSEVGSILEIIQNMEDKYRAFSSLCEHAERVSKTGSDIDVVECSDQMADFFGSKLKGQMTNASVPTTAASSAIGGRQRHFVFGGAQSYGSSSSFGFSQGLIAEKPAEEPKLSEFAAENWRQDIELCSPQQEAFAATPSSHAFTGGAFGFGVRSPASFGEAQQRAARPHASPLAREIVRCLGMVRRSPVADQVPREGVIVADVHGKVKMRPRQMNSQAQNQNPEHVHCLIGKDLTDIRGIFASPGNR